MRGWEPEPFWFLHWKRALHSFSLSLWLRNFGKQILCRLWIFLTFRIWLHLVDFQFSWLFGFCYILSVVNFLDFSNFVILCPFSILLTSRILLYFVDFRSFRFTHCQLNIAVYNVYANLELLEFQIYVENIFPFSLATGGNMDVWANVNANVWIRNSSTKK